MIAVGMSDDDVSHRLAAHRVKQRNRVASIQGAWIDDRHLAAANDVTQRPLEGERARIVGENAPHAGRDVVDDARSEVESAIEKDVFGHCLRWGRPLWSPCFTHCVSAGNRATTGAAPRHPYVGIIPLLSLFTILPPFTLAEASDQAFLPPPRGRRQGRPSHQVASAFAAVATVSTSEMMFFRTALFWICRNALMSRKPSLSSGTSNCSATATSRPASPDAEKKYVTGTSSILEIS